MKVGIIGCGGIGMMHAKALQVVAAVTELSVTAIADGREECRNHVKEIWQDCAEYESGMQLIEKADVECVFICLPSYLHAEHAMAAMEQGLDVFIEKPVCLKESDMEQLLSVQKRTGCRCMVGQVLRWFPEYRFLKKVYEENKFGRLKSLTMDRMCGVPLWSFENWFVDITKSGSVVMDLHIHDLDFARYLLGEPQQVSVRGTTMENGMPNQVVTVLDYPDTFAVIEGCWDISTALPFKSYYRACFEKATVEYDGTRNDAPVIIFHQDGKKEKVMMLADNDAAHGIEGINISDVGPYFEEDRYFIECVNKKAKVEKASLEDAVESAKLGCRILSEILYK